ncbi:MAG: hypothetical protein U9N50_08860 [Pseudomonadota bacterium]|nr:hypothetical protein [Pseudomonadota bacterium]
MKHEENRKGVKPVPGDPLKYMNEAQIHTYRLMRKFGWHMKFIRRQPLQRAVCVMTDPKMTALAVLEDNGFLNRQPDIPLRSTEYQVKE